MLWKACSAVALVRCAAEAVEDAAGFGLLFGFVAEEGVLEGGGGIGGVEPHGFAELVAGELVFADLEVGVGEVLADGGAVRRGGDGGEEGSGRRYRSRGRGGRCRRDLTPGRPDRAAGRMPPLQWRREEERAYYLRDSSAAVTESSQGNNGPSDLPGENLFKARIYFFQVRGVATREFDGRPCPG